MLKSDFEHNNVGNSQQSQTTDDFDVYINMTFIRNVSWHFYWL